MPSYYHMMYGSLILVPLAWYYERRMKIMFEILNEFGIWQLPNNTSWVNGQIVQDQSQYILKLDDAPSSEFNKYDVIVGNISGRCITLINLWINNISTVNGKTNNCEYIFEACFIGLHISNTSEINCKSISALFKKDMVQWFHRAPLIKSNYTDTGINYQFEKPDAINLKISESISVTVDFGYNSRNSHTEFDIKINAVVKISNNDNSHNNYSELLKTLYTFISFISILALHPVSPYEISFDVLNLNGSTICCKYYRGNIQESATHNAIALVTYEDIRESINKLLEFWFSNEPKFDIISYVLNKFIDSNYNPPSEIRFSQIVQAAEALHRRFFDDCNKMEREQAIKPYTDYLKALFGHEEKYMPINKDLQRSILSKVNYAHETIFTNRITELISGVPDQVKSKTILCESNFTNDITNLRNYFTHWDNNKNLQYSRQKIYDLSEAMKLLLIINIFKILGISDTIIVSKFERFAESYFSRSLVK